MTTYFISTLGLAFCLINALAAAGGPEKRPPITGISHMCVFSSDANAAEHFYAHILGAVKGADPQDSNGTRYYFSPTQFVEVLPLPAEHSISRMACVAYNTSDADGLLWYLRAHGVDGLSELRTGSDGSHWFQTKDPEGNQVQFIQPGRLPAVAADSRPIGTR